jgi:hypothetical protein
MKSIKFMVFCFAVLFASNTMAQKIYAEDVTINANGEATLVINLETVDLAINTQLTLLLPEGISIPYDEEMEEWGVKAGSVLYTKPSIEVSNDGNEYNFLIYKNAANAVYKSKKGSLLSITLKAGDLKAGLLEGTIKDVVLNNEARQEMSGFKNPSTFKIKVVNSDINTDDDAIYAEDATALKGGSGVLTVCLKNAQPTSAYSFDLLLPDGVTVDSYTLSSRHNEHTKTMKRNETTGVYSFAVLSLQSNEVAGNDGAILTLNLKVADNVAVGNYDVKIQNAKYSLTSGSASVSMPDMVSVLIIEDHIKGDVNGDGDVDIADAVCVVNYVVGKPTTNFVAKAADVNGDGDIDIADAVRIVNFVVGKIDALAPRF